MEALSKLTGNVVSKQSISKYEAGKILAGSVVLCKLAQALNVTVDYFFKPFSFDIHKADVSFRKKHNLGVKEINKLKGHIQEEVERFLEIEEILGIENTLISVQIPHTISTPIQMKHLANQLRQQWGLGTASIGNVTELLEIHGIKVFEVEGPKGFDGISGVANNNAMIIAINKAIEHTERLRLTKFHELAHLIANPFFSSELSNHDKEGLCNVFASELLLPSSVLEETLGHHPTISLRDIIDLQERYGLSIDAIMYSLKRIEIISEKRFRNYCVRKNTQPKLKAIVEMSRYHETNTDKRYTHKAYKSLVYKALSMKLISTIRASELLHCEISEVETNDFAI